MPSFDIVSKINMQELDNALNQAKKEIQTRYDFQGTKTELELSPDQKSIVLRSSSENRLEAAYDVLIGKLVKRGVSLLALTRGTLEQAGGQTVKQSVTLQQGVPVEKAKEIVKAIKESKLKVQASIQGEELRVSGKSRDDLQQIMALCRGRLEVWSIDLQFTNFRD